MRINHKQAMVLLIAHCFPLIAYFNASALVTISVISLVIAAWRALLRISVSLSIISFALSVASFIAIILDAFSEVNDCASDIYILVVTYFGNSFSNIPLTSGSNIYCTVLSPFLVPGLSIFRNLSIVTLYDIIERNDVES